MFAPDTPERESGGYPMPGSIMDIADHPDMDLPEPGHSPAMKHSTDMAGDVIPFPSSRTDPAPTNTSVKNDMARRGGKAGGDNIVRPIFK